VQLKVEQLESQLRRGLASCYLISGDEPLQSGEAADTIRRAAKTAGFAEREVLEQGTGFDWQTLSDAACSMSLFATRRIIDLRLSSSKIGTEGGSALVDFVRHHPPDTLLLVTCPRIERSQRNTRWVKALEAAGVWLQVWPKEGVDLVRWINQRLRAEGFQLEHEAASVLAERVEGNLLAAAQEVGKLSLLFAPGRLTADQLAEAVADSARFDVYAWVDSAMAGNPRRNQHMLRVLRGEGVPAALLLWALAREVRALCRMSARLAAGDALEQTLAANRIWEKRRPIIRRCLQGSSLGHWRSLLKGCAQVDAMIKGREPRGDPWGALGLLGLRLAGLEVMPPVGNRSPAGVPRDSSG